uniref:Uncharacterized protein n=1 Tax=Octopus bimaculoides TaxID=37653 RepID=A0A0L8FPP4_OCTBM
MKFIFEEHQMCWRVPRARVDRFHMKNEVQVNILIFYSVLLKRTELDGFLV